MLNATLQRKETEPSSSSAWNLQLPGAPPVDFDRFFDGYVVLLLKVGSTSLIFFFIVSESLDQEDIVAWINIGMHHIPQAEVRPVSFI